MSPTPRVAAAPISWGVSELPGWGHQISRQRVLGEMREIGFAATESGPPGYLPEAPRERRSLLQRYGLGLAAGFLATVLHDPAANGIAQIEVEARGLAASGADAIVVAAAWPSADYDRRQRLSQEQWSRLQEGLAAAEQIAAICGLTLAFHPHVGTAVQSAEDVETLLNRTDVNLCLDTGHIYLGGGDPTEVAATWGHRIRHVHLKNVDDRVASAFKAGELSYSDAVRRGLYTTLGDGDLDIAGVVDRILGTGYTGWFVLEQDISLATEPEPNGGPITSARESLAFFRRVAGAKPDVTGIST